MNRLKEVQDAITPVNLLEHPFYQEWSAGTLPVEKLSLYALEYGKFVHKLPNAWQTLGEEELVEEENEHAEMWDAFTEGLPSASEPTLAQTSVLLSTADHLFSSAPEAIGAMYAFEVQQPATAASKLEGLKAHYALNEQAQEYFLVHSTNQGEASLLAEKIAALPEDEYKRALGAARMMACALHGALDGVYYVKN